MPRRRAYLDPDIIGHNIRTLRLSNGYTQESLNQELCDRLVRNRLYRAKSLSDWDNGKTIPRNNTLREIADIFGVDYQIFINKKL